MKANELTTEDKARIFALYLGSPVEWGGEGYNQYMTGLDLSREGYRARLSWNGKHQKYCVTPLIEQCKLILKPPLSEISDEDAIWINDLFYGEAYRGNAAQGRGVIAQLIKPIYGMPFRSTWDKVTQANDYLRSKGYMIPYKGIDLFEAGIATSLTTN